MRPYRSALSTAFVSAVWSDAIAANGCKAAGRLPPDADQNECRKFARLIASVGD
jgi:hypothetical protein